jgi:hypothetical protein
MELVLSVMALCSFCWLIFDTLVGGFLMLGLYRHTGLYIDKMLLVRLIIQDGILYFVVVFLTHIAWMVVQILKDNKLVGFTWPGPLLHGC